MNVKGANFTLIVLVISIIIAIITGIKVMENKSRKMRNANMLGGNRPTI